MRWNIPYALARRVAIVSAAPPLPSPAALSLRCCGALESCSAPTPATQRVIRPALTYSPARKPPTLRSGPAAHPPRQEARRRHKGAVQAASGGEPSSCLGGLRQGILSEALRWGRGGRGATGGAARRWIAFACERRVEGAGLPTHTDSPQKHRRRSKVWFAASAQVPSAWRMSLLAAAIRARDYLGNAPRLARNCCAALLPGQVAERVRVPYRWTEIPANPAAILYLLARVHGYQVFFDGLFNGVRGLCTRSASPHHGTALLPALTIATGTARQARPCSVTALPPLVNVHVMRR